MSDTGLTRLEPEVRTLARPSSKGLLAARGEIQRNADLQVVFVKAKAERWPASRLAEAIQPLLEERIEESPEAIREASLYLADEYLQGEEGILLVSKETGRALARITEEDIWLPQPVRREDGSLVTPLPRLRPDLEGFLVQWAFDRSREERRVSELAPWQQQTAAARQITRKGRQELVEHLRADSENLLSGLKGSAKAFLDFVCGGQSDTDISADTYTPLPRMTAVARTRTPLADLKSFNPRFDVLSNQRAVLGDALVREMGRTLALHHPSPEPSKSVSVEGIGFWVAGTGAPSLLDSLYVDSDVTLGLTKDACLLVVHPESYRVESREVFDRWEIMAMVDYTLWVDWSKIQGYRLEVEHLARLV